MSIWEASIFFLIIHWCYIQGEFHRGHVGPTQEASVGECCSPPTCSGFKYDSRINSCCNGQVYKGVGLCCCGKSPYSAIQDTCCNGNLTRGLSELVSLCCGSVAYNPLNEICCRFHVYPRQSHSVCCGAGVIDTRTQLCCGPKESERALNNSGSYHCCGNQSFNTQDNCCFRKNVTIQPKNGSLCQQQLDKERNRIDPKPQGCVNPAKTPEPRMNFFCGSHEYDPSSHICCDGNLSELKDKNQCCGGKPYRVAERGKLCCGGILHHNVPEGSRCAGKHFYNPNNETVCENTIHPKAHGYCCGRDLSDPSTELCCNGYRYQRSPGKVCCGTEAYNSSDPMQKCCSGYLHKLRNMTGVAECCGTQVITNTSKQQCCISSQWELVYSSHPNFSCCGHQYYNTSQFYCCAGILNTSPRQNLSSDSSQAVHIKQCSRLNLTDLCSQPQNASVKLGTLEAAWKENSRRHIMLTNTFTIQLREGRAELKASPLLFTIDHCSCPELDTGRQYLWIDRSGDAGGYKVLIYPTQGLHSSLLSVVLSACKKY